MRPSYLASPAGERPVRGRDRHRRPADAQTSSRSAQALTFEAMRERRRRHLPGDVLRRSVARPRRLPVQAGRIAPARGSATWSYDIGDTKLARSVKAGAILQMCVYADLLEGLQGIAPEWLYVITGDRVRARPPDGRLLRLFPLRPGPLRRPGHGRSGGRPGRHLPRPGRPLSGLHLVPDVHRSPARRRPSLDRGRDAPRGHRAT